MRKEDLGTRTKSDLWDQGEFLGQSRIEKSLIWPLEVQACLQLTILGSFLDGV